MVNSMTRFLAVDSAKVDLKERKDKLNNSKTEYLSLDDIRGYKVYTALLTQTGTNAPVATVLENTLGEITFSRASAGLYLVNIQDIDVFKTIIINTYFETQTTSYAIYCFQDEPSITITTFLNGIQNDIGFINYPIEIRVYN